MKILLDTNVLVAAFATRGFCLDVLQLVLAEHRLLVGETILDELERILFDRLRMPRAAPVRLSNSSASRPRSWTRSSLPPGR